MGLKSLRGAKKILLPEDEYFWSCRAVHKMRQPWKLWMGENITREFYRGSPLGPNHWAIDVFGDESLQLVNVPGHTDGQAAVIVRNGVHFIVLAADAAFSPQNWRESITPGYGFDRRQQLKSLQWLAGMEKEPGCVRILCSHDADVKPQTIDFLEGVCMTEDRRYHFIDALRGLALVNMLAYHFMFDVNEVYGRDPAFYLRPWALFRGYHAPKEYCL